MTIDWSKPIEVYHTDGRTWPARVVYRSGTKHVSVQWTFEGCLPHAAVFTVDGEPLGLIEVRVRNVVDHVPDAGKMVPEHPTPTQYAPELVERMVAFILRCAGYGANRISGAETIYCRADDFDEARSIVSDLPQEVDPDEKYAEQLIKEMGWAGEAEIGEVAVRRLVAQAYAAGRQLQRGEAA